MSSPGGTTPLDPDEEEGLIPSIATLGELNEFESWNIIQGATWARRSRRVKTDLLSDRTLRELHRRMFGQTWRWAGAHRTTQKSIGCEAWQISASLRNLTEDVRVWIACQSYRPAEITARFHRKLVWIHPFPNGNGRFARLATDLLCEQQGWPKSSWGSADLAIPDAPPREYIAALQAADQHDFTLLIDFIAR